MVMAGSMFAQLALEDASFKSGMANAQKSLNRLSHESRKTGQSLTQSMGGIEKSVTGMTRSLKTAAGAFVGAFAVGALGNMVQEGLAYASSLGEVAQQLGVSTNALQEYRFAATQVGIEQADMDAALGKLTRSIGEAEAGSKSQAEAFRVLGVATRDANGNLKTTDQILPELVRAFSNIKDPAARAALQVDLFGKSGQKLDTLLSGGIEQVENLRNAAHRLGAVISPDLIARADDAADKMAALQTVLKSQIAGVVAQNADAILGIADAISVAANSVGQFFANMKGVERLQRDQGWAKGFFASWDEQKTAADPKKYVAKRIADLRDATEARRKAEAGAGGKDYFGFGAKALKDARARELESLRLLNAARADPAFQAALRPAKPKLPVPAGSDPMAALRTGGGGGKRSGGGRSSAARDTFGNDLSSLLERITPEDIKAVEQYTADQALLAQALKVGRINADEYAVALDRLTLAYMESAWGKRGPAVEDMGSAADALAEYLDPVKVESMALSTFESIDKQWRGVRKANDGLAVSFEETSHRILDSTRSLVDGIKGGDFLDVMEGILGLFTSLGSTGLFGKSIASNINGSQFGGARADGGPVGGGKAYLVGERGPELFMPGRSGFVMPNLNLRGISPMRLSHDDYVGTPRENKPQRVQIDLITHEAPGFASKVQVLSQGAAVEVNQRTASYATRAARQRLA